MSVAYQKQIVGIIVAGVLLRLLFAVVTPAWQSPDEYAHYWYAEQITINGFLPDSRPEFPQYEAFQSPLYYLMLTLPISIAPSYVPYSDTPAARPDFGLVLARLLSVLCATGTLLLTARILRDQEWLNRQEKAASLAFVAFLPTYVGVSSSVSNDSMAILIGALSLYYILHPQITLRRLQLAGFWAGIGFLTKLSAVLIIPVLLVGVVRMVRSRKLTIGQLIPGLLPFIFGAGLLLARNVWQFHDPFALNPGVAKQAGFSLPHFIHAFKTLAGSFFFAFGRTYQMILPQLIYLLCFAPALILAVYGWRKQWRELSGQFAILILPIMAGFAISLTYTMLYPLGGTTSWGRNLYPILPLIGIAVMVGLARVSSRLAEWISKGFAVVLLVLSLYGFAILVQAM